MQMTECNSMLTVITLSKRNIRELFENMDDPSFRGLKKLQVDDNDPSLDQRFVMIRVED